MSKYPKAMFRKIKLDNYVFLFSSLVFENEKPFIAYIRLDNKKDVIKNNSLLPLPEILESIIPQIEAHGFEVLSDMVENNYTQLEKRSYK